MKKIAMALLAALVFLLTVACAEEVVFPALEWQTDAANHWQLDENGEVINLGAHEALEDWLCEVCNSQILDWGDGWVDVTNYDAYGNTVCYTSYDENGEVIYQSFNVLTCNEDGIVLSDKAYSNNMLSYEAIYFVNENGEQIPVTETSWLEDGSFSVNQYDEYGNCVYVVSYAADGTLEHESISEYLPVEDEWFGLWFYECKNLIRFASGESFYTESNERGDRIRTLNTEADGTVWADYEYRIEYNRDMWSWRGTYTQGRLVFEEKYTEDGCLAEEIEYLEDGSKIVTLYDDNEDAVTATTYAADGTVISLTVYEHIYSEYGNILVNRTVTDGRVVEESNFLYEMDEDGWENCVGWTNTVYHEDGTYTVKEINNWMFAFSETLYAADGTVIEVFFYDEDDEIFVEE